MHKDYRLRSRKDIERVMRRGLRSENVLLRSVVTRNTFGHIRLALVVPRVVQKRAVVRNRIRRRAREWVRTHPEFLRIPLDIALIFKKPASTSPRKLFYEELARVFAAFRA